MNSEQLFGMALGLHTPWHVPDPLLRRPRGRYCLEAPQAVRYHVRRSRQRRLCPVRNFFLGELQLLQADLHRPARFRGLYGRDERHLVLRIAPALAAQVGVIDLDAPIQLTQRFPLDHDLRQLVLEQPSDLP